MKRTRSIDSRESNDDHDDHERDIIIQNLKQKLLEVEGKLESVSSFSLHQNQIDHDLFQSSYADPLIHYELKALNDRHNYLVKKTFELEKLLAKETPSIPASFQQQHQQLIEKNKKLVEELSIVKSEKSKLTHRFESSQRFIEYLQKELLDVKKKNKELEDENNKVNSQLFLVQQFQQQSHPAAATAIQYSHHLATDASDTVQHNNASDDYNPFEHDDASSHSPVLLADD